MDLDLGNYERFHDISSTETTSRLARFTRRSLIRKGGVTTLVRLFKLSPTFAMPFKRMSNELLGFLSIRVTRSLRSASLSWEEPLETLNLCHLSKPLDSFNFVLDRTTFAQYMSHWFLSRDPLENRKQNPPKTLSKHFEGKDLPLTLSSVEVNCQ